MVLATIAGFLIFSVDVIRGGRVGGCPYVYPEYWKPASLSKKAGRVLSLLDNQGCI